MNVPQIFFVPPDFFRVFFVPQIFLVPPDFFFRVRNSYISLFYCASVTKYSAARRPPTLPPHLLVLIVSYYLFNGTISGM